MPLPVYTPRLVLRRFTTADVDSFAAYRADPAIARYQSWDESYSTADAVILVADMQYIQPGTPGEWYQVALALRQTGELIGDCGFCVLAEDPRQAEIGFTVARPYQGQGYAAEAIGRLMAYLFAEYNLHRIRAICHEDNHASAKLLARLGLRREAHFIEHYWFKGAWASEYWYGILRREWDAQLQNRV